MKDWKDMLAGLRPDVPQAEPEPETLSTPQEERKEQQTLHLILDKKGRKGKMATIIEGFTLNDDEVAEIASDLKRKIGTGGSSRGGEILLQGDWRSRAAELLRARGFKVKTS